MWHLCSHQSSFIPVVIGAWILCSALYWGPVVSEQTWPRKAYTPKSEKSQGMASLSCSPGSHPHQCAHHSCLSARAFQLSSCPLVYPSTPHSNPSRGPFESIRLPGHSTSWNSAFRFGIKSKIFSIDPIGPADIFSLISPSPVLHETLIPATTILIFIFFTKPASKHWVWSVCPGPHWACYMRHLIYMPTVP